MQLVAPLILLLLSFTRCGDLWGSFIRESQYDIYLKEEKRPFILVSILDISECKLCKPAIEYFSLFMHCIPVYAMISPSEEFLKTHPEIQMPLSVNMYPQAHLRTREVISKSALSLERKLFSPNIFTRTLNSYFNPIDLLNNRECVLPVPGIHSAGFWEVFLPGFHVVVIAGFLIAAFICFLRGKKGNAIFNGFSAIFLLSTSGFFHLIVKKSPIVIRTNEFMEKHSPVKFLGGNKDKTFFAGMLVSYGMWICGVVCIATVVRYKKLKATGLVLSFKNSFLGVVAPAVFFLLWKIIVSFRG